MKLLLGVLFSFAAAAQTTMRLEHSSDAANCPDAPTLQRLVAERLGRDPFTLDAPRKLTVHFAGQSGAFRADLKVLDEKGATKGARALSSSAATCSELASSVALAIALIIDPLLVTRPPPAEEPLPPPPPPPPTYPPDEAPPPPPSTLSQPPSPPPPQETPRSVHALLGAGLSAAVLQVPTPSGGLGIWAAAEGEKWTAGGRVSVWTPGSTNLGTVGVSMMVIDAGPFGCVKFAGRFGACGLLKLGAQVAWAQGTPLATSAVGPEFAIGTEPYADVFLTDVVRLRFRLGAQLNLALASLKVAGAQAYQTSIATFWLGMDVAFRATGP